MRANYWSGAAVRGVMTGLALLGLGASMPPTSGADGGTVEAGELYGHSAHGEAFDEGPRQAAYLMEGMPRIDFAVSTSSEEAGKFFNQGVGQLHGFWYFEAERSFRQVARLDTNCVMAYWGLAMANVYNGERAKLFVEKAVARTNGVGRREFLWVESLAKFYLKEQKNEVARHREYVRSLEQIVEEFPEDIEAKAFLLFKVWENGGRSRISSHTATDALAREILAANPLHPVHHARIHLWNGEADRRALDSAARCGQSSPGIAHMWHMPGHTYTKLHRYADAAWQQEASARVDHAYMMRNWVLPDQIHNYSHNNEWLARNLSYLGRVREAIDLAKNLVELPRHPKYNSFEAAPVKEREKPAPDSSALANANRRNSALYGRWRLLETLGRWELWDEMIALSGSMYLEPTEVAEEEVRKARVLGIAYFSRGDLKNGELQMAVIEEELRKQRRLAGRGGNRTKARVLSPRAASQLSGTRKVDGAKAEGAKRARERFGRKLNELERNLAELEVYRALATGDEARAANELKGLGAIPDEREARLWVRLGDFKKAEKLARGAAERGTNQVHSLANYVDVLEQIGKAKEAEELFGALRRVAAQADLDTPIMRRVSGVARRLGLPEDWREEYKVPEDTGDRPTLESLGPFRWQPVPAPEWNLADADGNMVSLEDYRGKPVVAIFYLGAGCLHCVEQLNAFAPMAERFGEAGIELVAISTESREVLKRGLRTINGGAGFSFPVLADEELEVFRKYRAFDDFEELPLHGTFLIDGRGLVRWRDISYEPFTEPEFLLKEARRLLQMPTGTVLAGRSVGETNDW